jgi:hypothetical protein
MNERDSEDGVEPTRDSGRGHGPERDSGDGDGPKRDALSRERDGALPVRQASGRSAIRPARRVHDPEVLEQVLQSLINLQ